MLAMFARELTTRHQQPRGQPPSASLGTARIIAAMHDGGGVAQRTAGGYLFHSARISQAIVGSRCCVDLGCGTGAQLLQVADLNPATHFIGVDCNPELLEIGRIYAAECGVANVEWRVADATRALTISDRPIDAAISTMALHDLNDITALGRFLSTMNALSGPTGAIYIEDFARLRVARSIDFFTTLNAPNPPDAHAALFRCGLASAFTLEELKAACAALARARLHATFLVPFMVIVKTADRALAPTTRSKLQAMRAAFPDAYRRDLDDLRRFFALGGLTNDPFD